nr:type II secretion system minor pseudopilin GspK [uncultured Steroidobacter sp.]
MSRSRAFVRAPDKRHQRGVALVVAVLIVALATILAAEVGFRGYLDQRRTVNTFSLDQSFEIAMGGEAWASDALRRDKMQGTKTDDFTEEWATPIPPIPLEDVGGEFEGQLEDLQGRFNLNDLVSVDPSGASVVNQPAVERFARLLTLLELEPKWAGYIADWIDSDNNAGFPDGAEDPVYTNLSPPYRTANMPITRASELLALPEFGAERYRKLAPFVTALPPGQHINLCTASPELLDAMIGEGREFTLARDAGKQTRAQRCFPTVTEFQASLSAQRKEELNNVIGETSDYFLATIWVTLGTQRLTLYSLLYRGGGANQVRPILRSYGTL